MTARTRTQSARAAHIVLIALMTLLLAAALTAPVRAAEPEPPAPAWRLPDGRSAGELAREGAEKFLQALDGLAKAIPQYALPEINQYGDIIIRRKNPLPAAPTRPHRPGPDGAVAI